VNQLTIAYASRRLGACLNGGGQTKNMKPQNVDFLSNVETRSFIAMADNERLKQLWTEQRSELLKLRIEIQKTAGALKGVMSCVDAILKEMSLGQYNDLSPQTRTMIETQMAKGRTCLIPH